MNTSEYLITQTGNTKFGFFAKDIFNVYNNIPKIRSLSKQHDIYTGITKINDKLVSVIDFKKRLAIPSNMSSQVSGNNDRSMIVFNINVGQYIAILIDQIIGFKNISQEDMVKSKLNNNNMNMNLLMPNIARMKDKSLVMIIDITYLEKIEQIEEEDTGGLELF